MGADCGSFGEGYVKRFHIKGDRKSVFAFDKVEGKVRRLTIQSGAIDWFECDKDLAEKIEEVIEDIISFSDFDIVGKQDLEDLSWFIANGLSETSARKEEIDSESISKMTWTLWENTTPFPFWTSDRPIVRHSSIPNPKSTDPRHSIIYFPLNPRLCIVLYGREFKVSIVGRSRNRNLYRVLGDQENFVKQQNSLQLDYCQRLLFSNLEDFRFARKLLSR